MLKFVPEIITSAPTAPLPGLKPEIVGEGNIVKEDELGTVTPLVVTEINPEDAPDGTVVTMVVELAEVTTAVVPLNDTVGEALKLVPVMVTVAPTAPLTGVNPEIDGIGNTIKFVLLETVTPFTVKEIKPVPAPTGTMVVILLEVEAVTIAATPLNLILFSDGVTLKLFPETITVAPTAPEAGLNPVMLGVGNTVKSLVLITVTPLTVTEILPVEAPAGTVVVTLLDVEEVTTAFVVLNFTT